MENVFNKIDVRVFDKFIDKFAQKYIEQRFSLTPAAIEEALKVSDGLGVGFDLSQIKNIVRQNSVFVDPIRERGETPNPVNDIYRSDLGELLVTYYFEEKLNDSQWYI